MPYRYQLTQKNQHGDNGWWKKTGDTLAHYFVKKLPLCGTRKFNNPDIGVQPKTAYDRRCKNCSKVRRNQLRARMNKLTTEEHRHSIDIYQSLYPSPKKPQ